MHFQTNYPILLPTAIPSNEAPEQSESLRRLLQKELSCTSSTASFRTIVLIPCPYRKYPKCDSDSSRSSVGQSILHDHGVQYVPKAISVMGSSSASGRCDTYKYYLVSLCCAGFVKFVTHRMQVQQIMQEAVRSSLWLQPCQIPAQADRESGRQT
jgi:hypothetical protein